MHSWKIPGLPVAIHLSVFRYLQKLAGVSEEDAEDEGWCGEVTLGSIIFLWHNIQAFWYFNFVKASRCVLLITVMAMILVLAVVMLS